MNYALQTNLLYPIKAKLASVNRKTRRLPKHYLPEYLFMCKPVTGNDLSVRRHYCLHVLFARILPREFILPNSMRKSASRLRKTSCYFPDFVCLIFVVCTGFPELLFAIKFLEAFSFFCVCSLCVCVCVYLCRFIHLP